MLVYVNWETQEVVGPNQIEEIIDRRLSDCLKDDQPLEEYLAEYYTLAEVWHMDDRQKENVMEDYTIHQKEQAEEWFDNEFCEYEVE